VIRSCEETRLHDMMDNTDEIWTSLLKDIVITPCAVRNFVDFVEANSKGNRSMLGSDDDFSDHCISIFGSGCSGANFRNITAIRIAAWISSSLQRRSTRLFECDHQRLERISLPRQSLR
jgi:hypothetical protein